MFQKDIADIPFVYNCMDVLIVVLTTERVFSNLITCYTLDILAVDLVILDIKPKTSSSSLFKT